MSKFFSVDARAILALGRDSIKDHTTAIVELVKNSYDADASKVEIDIKKGREQKSELYIRIADDGSGMTEDEVEKFWLRIGHSEKRIERFTSAFNRRKTGEKGIGRLSADRLGEELELRSRKRGAVPFGLSVNWSLFDQSGKDVSSIPIDELNAKHAVPTVPMSPGGNGKFGTELIIRKLRQSWEPADLQTLHEELSLLTPPFSDIKRDFEIVLDNEIDKELNGPIKSSFLNRAELEFRGKFSKEGVLSYQILGRSGKIKTRVLAKGDVKWLLLTTKNSKFNSHKSETPHIGPFEIRLLFYPQKRELLEGTKFSLADLASFLRQNSGVKIYRDGIRVKPYGDPSHPEGDWLALAARKISNPAGAGRKSFRISANQLVGAVFLQRDRNPSLADSSSREGLIHGDSYKELSRAVIGCIYLLESQYHAVFKERKESTSSKAAHAKENIARLNVELKDLTSGLAKIKEEMPAGATRTVETSLDQIQSVIQTIDTTSRAIEELASQNTVFRGLATVGIAAAVFGHETQTSLAATRQCMSLAFENLTGKKIFVTEALRQLEKARNHAEKTSQWGRFALLRVKNDKRKKSRTKIGVLVEGILKDLRPAYEASGIEIAQRIDHIEARTFPMDIESIVINLLTNAYTACQQISKNRRIRFVLKNESRSKKEGFLLEVADSGPGIAKEHSAQVWEPLFTTKVDEHGRSAGTGLGLTIVNSIVDELGGTKEMDRDPVLRGARFRIWVPI